MLKRVNSYIICCTMPLLFFMISGCANQISPPGGKVDTIPPDIVDTYPQYGSTNFADDHIELEFSEYVDKRSLQDAIFISPAIEGELEFDWSGKGVRIKFPEKLKEDITYVITVGTEVSDLNNNNNMAQSYSLAFSTGSVIDQGSIRGRVFDDNPSGVFMLAYDVSQGDINPAVQKPKYVSQTGLDGRFSFLGLANGIYRVFALKQDFRDFLYHKGSDSYGSPYEEVTISPNDTLHLGMNYFLTREDTIAPRLSRAAMTDNSHILLEFSEEMDSSIVNPAKFEIIDSTSGQRFSPLYAYKGKTKVNELALAVKNNFTEGNNVFVLAKEIRDLAGNITPSDYSSLVLSARADTSAPSVMTIQPDNNQTLDIKAAAIKVNFDDAFDPARAKGAISFSDKTGAKIPFTIAFPDNASIHIGFPSVLKARTEYSLILDLRNFVDASGNSGDSLYVQRFTSSTGTDYSGVSGDIENNEDNDTTDYVVILRGTGEQKKVYNQRIRKREGFNLGNIDPGKYILWGFQDRNGNGKYDHGAVYPFKPSERFAVSSDTLNLRARWPVSGAVLRFRR